MEKTGCSNYIDKPWGYELEVERIPPVGNEGFTVRKILVILTNQELSYQYHNKRTEMWEVKYGECEISINGVVYVKVFPGTIWKINPKDRHSIKALTPTAIEEISTGYEDDDIIRLEDKYGRAKKCGKKGV